MYSIYALFNNKHKRIYIGQTENLKERLVLHKNKLFKNSYTAKLDGDWKLIHSEEVSTRKDALKREKQLKSYRGREFIKSLIES
jgi:putative endonuclease